MSGHSKWSQIKHKKALTDAKKGKIFSKITRTITMAARQKGPDPQTNHQLRLAIEKAKEVNMPSDNIERAVKRGIGDAKGIGLETFLYEACGPAGSTLIITGITDNKNRSLNEIKRVLADYGGKIADPGSVLWMFKQKAIIMAEYKGPTSDAEKLELALIDAGIDDIEKNNGVFTITLPFEKSEAVKKLLNKHSMKEVSFDMKWLTETVAHLDKNDKDRITKLSEALLQNDDVQEVYSNAE